MRALTALGTANSLPSPRTKDSAEEPVDTRRSISTHVQDERVRAVPGSRPTLGSSVTGNSEPRNTSEASQCPTQERRLGSARSLSGSLTRRLVPHIPTELADSPPDRRSPLRKLARSKVNQDDEQTDAQPPGLPQTVDHFGTAARAALRFSGTSVSPLQHALSRRSPIVRSGIRPSTGSSASRYRLRVRLRYRCQWIAGRSARPRSFSAPRARGEIGCRRVGRASCWIVEVGERTE
jgi:hypothetical protein